MSDASPPIERMGGTDDGAIAPAAICVHHGGRCFVTNQERAGMFLRKVQSVSDRGRSELVPLLHNGGVELLLVASNVPLQVHDVRDRSLDGGHPRGWTGK